MAKIRSRKRRINWLNIGKILMFLAVISWLLTSLFVNTRNAELTIKIQELNEELMELENENETIGVQIKDLENKDRVYVIAQSDDMSLSSTNVVSLSEE